MMKYEVGDRVGYDFGGVHPVTIVRDDNDGVPLCVADQVIPGLASCHHGDLYYFLADSRFVVLPETKETNPKDAVGIKKVPMSVVPATVTFEVAVGLLEGARKYGRHNWRDIGVRASVYYDAAHRHLAAWWEGEDVDPDSGLHHVTKAITSLVVLRDALLRDKCEDDRPPASPGFLPPLNARAAELVERFPSPPPPHLESAE